MDIKDVEVLARQLMEEHGLREWKWSLKFIRSHSVAGLCYTHLWSPKPHLSRGRIELSIDFMEAFDEFHVRDTILHEIAHALTKTEYGVYQSGRRKGQKYRIVHGEAWKATAKRIGCTGERCVSLEAPRPKAKYRLVCPNGHELSRNRMTHRGKYTSCCRCSNTYNPEFHFNWYEGEKLVHRNWGTPQGGFTLTTTLTNVSPEVMSIMMGVPVEELPKARREPVTASRAAEYDKGQAFINWD